MKITVSQSSMASGTRVRSSPPADSGNSPCTSGVLSGGIADMDAGWSEDVAPLPGGERARGRDDLVGAHARLRLEHRRVAARDARGAEALAAAAGRLGGAR